MIRLFTSIEIEKAIYKLSTLLAEHLELYCAEHEIIFIVVLKSGGRFAFKLFDNLLFPFRYTFVYTKEQDIDKYKTSLGIPNILHCDLSDINIDGNIVVILDSICESGATLKALERILRVRYKPLEVFSCTMIRKQNENFSPHFYSLTVKKNQFLVGWGMALSDKHRNLQAVHKIEE